jgi:hypothetical protein
MRNSLVGIALAALLVAVTADAQSVSFARWKNNATAAYSLNHDDYGYDWWGDFAFMDSILTNRGLTVSFSVIAAQLDRSDSARAAAYVRKGYRFICHGMNHICDTPITANNPVQRYSTAYEYDSARARIERMIPSQGKCLYWATPCGNQSADNVTWLRTHGYIGCRNDINGLFPGSPYDVADPFRIGEGCYQPASAGAPALNSYVQQAIDAGNWASRQAHCVSDNSGLGWAPIPLADYRTHMDWCRQQIDAGRLWMAPVQTVLMYALERSRWSVAVTSSDATHMLLDFDTDSIINPYVDNHLFTVALTLLAGLPSGWSAQDAQAVQQGVELAKVVANSTTIRFDANPWAGVVTVNRTAVPVLSQPLRPMQSGIAAAAAVFGLDGRLVGRTSSGSAAALVRWDYTGHAGVTILQVRQ